MLYILNRSPYVCDFVSLISIINSNDTLLLIADGVNAVLQHSLSYKIISASKLTVYALLNDVIARGLRDHISCNVKMIDYTGFVILTEQQLKQITW